MSTYLYVFDYGRWLESPLPITVPLNSVAQSVNAAYTFTFMPKKEDPGFAAVSDKAVLLSYFTIVENSFYALQLLFACCYLHDSYFQVLRKTVVIEALFVFFRFLYSTFMAIQSNQCVTCKFQKQV